MYKNKRILGLIPARGGSKGLPGKNIRKMFDKPLIVWTIEEAKKSKYLDTLITSTDDKNIADIAKKHGCDTPFLRPIDLASDTAPTIDTIIHAIDWLGNRGEVFDYLVLLEPTSPLRETQDIDDCIQKIIDTGTAAIVSVAPLESGHPEFNVIIDKKTDLISKIDGTTDFNVLRRQDLSDAYFFDGTIYVSRIVDLIEKKNFYHDSTLGYIVPRWKSQEVDTVEDFISIEAILKARQKGLIQNR